MKSAVGAAALALAALLNAGVTQAAAQAPGAEENAQRDEAPIDPARGAQRVISGINAFSLDLYKKMIPEKGNLFLSPASVSTAMALAYRGAVGQTAIELRKVMRYSAEPESYLQASAGVTAALNFAHEGGALQTANAIWVQQGLEVNPEYRSDAARYMHAGLHETDFKNDHETARAAINGWVAAATHGRIADLLQKGVLTHDTQSVLVNAIYWKGAWAAPFDAVATRVEPFTDIDGGKHPISLMHQQGNFASLDRGGLQVIALPYAGGDVDMIVMLPRSPKGLPRFEAALTEAKLSQLLDQLQSVQARDTMLALPRMRCESEKDLRQPLSDMGAPTAFGESADFSGMASNPNAKGLKIDHVIHKAWLTIDEKGTEAAAATGIVDMVVTAARRRRRPPPPVVFRADRPFLYLLRARKTGMILFMGRYVAASNEWG